MERLTNSDYHFCANCHNYNDCAHTEDNGFPVCPERARHDRLAAIEDILGDEYDLELLQKLVEAEREGRFIVVKEPRQAGAHRITELVIGDRVMGGWNFGKLLFRAHEEAEAALRREQE